MPTADMLEALMLFFFSIGWYWSIARMLRCGSTVGKSLTFVTFVTIGYGLGVAAHLIRLFEGGGAVFLLVVYAWNLLVVVIDLVLVVVIARRERARARTQRTPF